MSTETQKTIVEAELKASGVPVAELDRQYKALANTLRDVVTLAGAASQTLSFLGSKRGQSALHAVMGEQHQLDMSTIAAQGIQERLNIGASADARLRVAGGSTKDLRGGSVLQLTQATTAKYAAKEQASLAAGIAAESQAASTAAVNREKLRYLDRKYGKVLDQFKRERSAKEDAFGSMHELRMVARAEEHQQSLEYRAQAGAVSTTVAADRASRLGGISGAFKDADSKRRLAEAAEKGDLKVKAAEGVAAAREESALRLRDDKDRRAEEKKQLREAAKAAAKAAAGEEGAGGSMLSAAARALPGGGMLSQVGGFLNRVSPTFAGNAASAAKAFGQWGSQMPYVSYNAMGMPIAGLHTGGGTPGGSGVGNFGAFAGGLAGSAAGGALLAAAGARALGGWGVNKFQSLYGGRMQGYMGLEQALRGAQGLGGAHGVFANLDAAGSGNLASRYGMSQAQSADAYMQLLGARGMPSAMARGQAAGWLDMAAQFGVSPALLGSFAGRGVSAYGGDKMLRHLYASGVAGPELERVLGGMSNHAEGLAQQGLRYKSWEDARFASELAPSMGRDKYGGSAAILKLQGVGQSPVAAFRNQMAGIADMMVLAEAAKGGGDVMEIMERTANMTGRGKYGAMKGFGGAGEFALWGSNFSKDQIRKMKPGLPSLDEPTVGDVPLSARQQVFEAGMTRKGAETGTFEALQTSMNNMEQSLAAMLEFVAFFKAYLVAKDPLASAGSFVLAHLM